MDTTYYTVCFRSVKVAGGEDRTYLIPEVRAGREDGPGKDGLRTAAAPKKGRGELVSLEMGKARMERRQAWKALVETAWGK